MTSEGDDPFTTTDLGGLEQALDEQDEPDDGSRAAVLDCLRRRGGATGGGGDATTAGILDLIAGSSLGAPPDDDVSVPADPLEVAGVLDRLDAAEREADGAPEAWTREFVRLCRAATSQGGLSAALEESGVGLSDDLTGVVARPALFAGRTLDQPGLAERAVEALGASWADSGFRALYQAARRTRRSGDSSAVLQLSGLAGVSIPDRETALAWIEAPLDGLPVLRGREPELARITGPAQRRRVRVLHGPGGYGKTTLALVAAARIRTGARPVLRVPAPDLDELVDGLYLAALGTGATVRGLELAMQAPPRDRAERLWRLLDATPVPWVIVLDDVGADLAGHPAVTRGSSGGTVLVTTRHGGDVWGGCDVVELERLSVEQGGLVVQDLIDPGRGRAGMAARALSRLLGGVPLALATAGRLAAAARVGDGRLRDLAVRLGRLDTDNPVSAVYELGVGMSAGMRSTFRLLSCFAPDEPVPLGVLAAYPEVVGSAAPSVSDLLRTGLVDVRVRSGQRCLVIHAAHVERSRRDAAVEPREARAAAGYAVDLLLHAVEGLNAGAPANWALLRLLEPHVAELLADPALEDAELLARAVRVAERTAAALLRSGDQVLATALLDTASARADAALDERHPARVALRHTRAWTTALDGGDFALAEQELREVLRLRTETLGAHHPYTLSTYDRLAWVAAEQGRLEQARAMAVEILAVRETELGPTHEHTMATRHRLAWIDALLGRDRDALAGFTEVLAQRREHLGDAHLDTYSSRYRLAWTLTRLTAYDRAEAVYRELQSELEQTVGPEHPLTLMVRVRVGWVMVWRNRLDDAEQHYADVLVDQEKVLGADHLRVLRTRHFQACLALNRGEVATAIERMRPVVAEREERLGVDHSHTMDSRSYLAEAYLQAGQVDAADREWQAVLADRQRVLGELHPITLMTRYWLVRARLRRGRLDEAQQMAHRLITDQRRVLPADNRQVFNARHTLARVNARRGRLSTAEQQLRSVLADRTRVLGADHRETLATRDHLAGVLRQLGRVEEGVAEATAVLADRTRVLGPRHPHTLTSRYRLARLVDDDPRRDDAEALLVELLADASEILGADHPDTLRCRHLLVRMRRRAGETETAIGWARDLLADQIRVRGEDAVATLRTAEELGRALLDVPGSGPAGRALLNDVLARRTRALGEDHPDTVRVRDFLATGRESGDPGGTAV